MDKKAAESGHGVSMFNMLAWVCWEWVLGICGALQTSCSGKQQVREAIIALENDSVVPPHKIEPELAQLRGGAPVLYAHTTRHAFLSTRARGVSLS